jgi:hypothetical protein
MTVVGCLGGSAIAILAWIQTQRMKGEVSNTDEIALYVQASIYTLLGILSVVGFVGACSRSATLISIYFSMLVAHLGFSIFSGAFSLYAIFHGDGKAIMDTCITQYNDDGAAQGITSVDATKDCHKALAIFRGLAIAVFICFWLIEIYCCFIVHDYSAQLDEEDFIKLPPHRDSSVEAAQINLGRPATEYGP